MIHIYYSGDNAILRWSGMRPKEILGQLVPDAPIFDTDFELPGMRGPGLDGVFKVIAIPRSHPAGDSDWTAGIGVILLAGDSLSADVARVAVARAAEAGFLTPKVAITALTHLLLESARGKTNTN